MISRCYPEDKAGTTSASIRAKPYAANFVEMLYNVHKVFSVE
jgi:hypothetical protein